jgi:hypothetical protein
LAEFKNFIHVLEKYIWIGLNLRYLFLRKYHLEKYIWVGIGRFFNDNTEIVPLCFSIEIKGSTTWVKIGNFFNENIKKVPLRFCRKEIKI